MAHRVGRAAVAACEMATLKLEEFETGATDVLVIAVALIRRADGVGTYMAAHYKGCPACISEHAAQLAIDVVSTGFIEMTQAGHADAAHS